MQREQVLTSALSSDWWKSVKTDPNMGATDTWRKNINESCLQQHEKESFAFKLWMENSILLIFLTLGCKMNLEATCFLVNADESLPSEGHVIVKCCKQVFYFRPFSHVPPLPLLTVTPCRHLCHLPPPPLFPNIQ